ncbi:MAG: glutamyl-tRNA reductase [Deltaproteobacteria bacterium]|nr:glutamyl-tRNA reductase [Deltaproteobacteria bacterium]
MKIILVGLNHRSAPLEVRERLAVDDVAPLLQKLVASDEIDEAVLVSTCNRVEVVALTRSVEPARHRLRSFFRRDLDGGNPGDGSQLEDHLYEYTDAEAMRHVLRVSSALDSMVVGEPQILGQMKDAYRAAAECKASGPILNRLFQHAFTTAKRVRTETRVAERPVSVARVAVDLARQIFEDFSDKQALLIGAGEMIEAALSALRSAGIESVAVANRTPERAADLAVRFEATAHGLDELPHLVSEADVVLSCIGGNRPILTRDLIEAALRNRRHRPIFVIDIGVPRNAEPEVDTLDNVYLYDIDDLGAVSDQNAEQRRRETVLAEALVAEEQQRFDGWFTALRAVPTIKHLRTHVEKIRRTEVDKTLAKLEIGELEREQVESLTRSIVNKILHAPLSRLRREAEREEGMAYLETARALFGLDEEPEAPSASAAAVADDAESE